MTAGLPTHARVKAAAMAATATASPKISVQALNGLLELTVSEARS